jgi:LPXTG-site transpeptidase (sortase) family protein
MGALNGVPIVWYKKNMNTNNKRKIGIVLVAAAVLVFSYTIAHSVFYTTSGDSGVDPIVNTANVEASTVTSSSIGGTAENPVIDSQNPQSPTSAEKTLSEVPSKHPQRLIIPKLDIDAKILDMGINAAGNMDAPHNFVDVGWFKLGTVPGEIGSSVIDGHEDNGLSLDGVFKHLEDLRPGDDVYVVQADGKKLHFKVEVSEIYPYNNAPLQKIFARADKARLNLITCAGSWLKEAKTNDKRLVVYTVLVND